MADEKTPAPDLIRRELPPLRQVSLAVLAVVLLVALILPLFSPFKRWAETGPGASVHAEISKDCQICHQSPFVPVRNSACESCHEMSPHGAEFARRTGDSPDDQNSCASCHMEHNGPHGLIARDARQCTSCHASLPEKAEIEKVPSFTEHPEFQLPERDRSALKLNHKVHLAKGIQGAEGKVTLECGDCHRLSQDRRRLLPIRFERDCQSCHQLTFDERLSERRVPHASANTVFRTLYAEYAQLALQGPAAFREPAPEPTGRERPGKSAELRQAPLPARLDRELVLTEARRAEAQLFEKTACVLCHEVSARPVKFEAAKSRYAVEAVELPVSWMKQARFNHGAHDELTCESCHAKTRKSKQTSDVLMPVIEDCRSCHGDAHADSKVPSDCRMCHSYHDARPLPLEKKRNLKQILGLN